MWICVYIYIYAIVYFVLWCFFINNCMCFYTDKKDTNISFLEMENERLQRQLLLLQEQKLISSNRRKDNREGRPSSAGPLPSYTSAFPIKSLNKWAQTNPVPIDQVDKSGIPERNYSLHRQNARDILEQRWRIPARMNDAENKMKQIFDNAVDNRNYSDNNVVNECNSLQPERTDTVLEASNFEFYDPDQPLDIDWSAMNMKPKKQAFPIIRDCKRGEHILKSVIVKSERPYWYCDFYGRPLDHRERLLDCLEKSHNSIINESIKKHDNVAFDKSCLALKRLAVVERKLMESQCKSLHLSFLGNSHSKKSVYGKNCISQDQYFMGTPKLFNLPLPIEFQSTTNLKVSHAATQCEPIYFNSASSGMANPPFKYEQENYDDNRVFALQHKQIVNSFEDKNVVNFSSSHKRAFDSVSNLENNNCIECAEPQKLLNNQQEPKDLSSTNGGKSQGVSRWKFFASKLKKKNA